MSREELEKKAKEYSQRLYHSKAWNPGEDMLVKAYLAGAKEMQKENDAYWQNIITEQHKLVDECRIKIEEENEQLKAQIMKMRGCINCTHFQEYNGNTDVYVACELEKCENLENWEFRS